jgi:uncharacterized protein (TIGR03086 family)
MSRSFKTARPSTRQSRGMTEDATTLTAARMMAEAASTVAAAVRACAGADLAVRTPCGDWDLRTLARHFTGTSGAFVRSGRTGALDPDDPWGSNAVLDEAGWADRLADQVTAAGEAWSHPDRWAGSIEGAQMPAAFIGEMALIELVLHGWDVARAGGQTLSVSDELGAELLRCLEPTLDQGRQYEVYGAPVSVPDGASALDRALALSGRDPDWGR